VDLTGGPLERVHGGYGSPAVAVRGGGGRGGHGGVGGALTGDGAALKRREMAAKQW
jgi:hypothetical protein